MRVPSRTDRRFGWAVCAIVAGALVLRLAQIGHDSFWVDEINVLTFVRSGHLLTDVRARGGPFEPPLHYVAVWLASFLPIGFEAAARVPAAIFGTLEVFALAFLTRRLSGRRDVAILAGAYLALAPFAVRYSQENRYYTTFSALHLVSWWLLLRALQTRSRPAFIWWGVAVAFLILAHPFAPLVVLVQLGLIAGIARHEHRTGDPGGARALAQSSVRGVVIALVGVTPWYLWGLVQWLPDLLNGRSYRLNTGSRDAVSLDFDLVKRVAQWLLANGGRWTILSVLLGALVGVGIALGRAHERRVARWVAAYTAGFFLGLIPLARALNTYFAMRRIEFLLPPILLLAALGTVAIADRFRDRCAPNPFPSRRAMVVLVTAVLGLSATATLTYYSTEKSNYRALAEVVRTTPAKDSVVIGPVDPRWPSSIRSYLSWSRVHRKIRFLVVGRNVQHVPEPHGDLVWITGSPPEGPAFTTRGLNSIPDLQVIAGDRTSPGSILPWFVSTTMPTSRRELQSEFDQVSRLPVLLAPPASSFPWWLFIGR